MGLLECMLSLFLSPNRRSDGGILAHIRRTISHSLLEIYHKHAAHDEKKTSHHKAKGTEAIWSDYRGGENTANI